MYTFTDVAQVANVARNYEILHERDDDGAERPDKRQKSVYEEASKVESCPSEIILDDLLALDSIVRFDFELSEAGADCHLFNIN
nr:hypothetical protein [Tanacetum cinerariifolium]